MADERAPPKGRVELDKGLEVPLLARQPREHHNDPVPSVLPPPVEAPSLPPHLRTKIDAAEARVSSSDREVSRNNPTTTKSAPLLSSRRGDSPIGSSKPNLAGKVLDS